VPQIALLFSTAINVNSTLNDVAIAVVQSMSPVHVATAIDVAFAVESIRHAMVLASTYNQRRYVILGSARLLYKLCDNQLINLQGPIIARAYLLTAAVRARPPPL
jgi:hypothetical protein